MSVLKDIRNVPSAQGNERYKQSTGKVDLRKLRRVDLLELLVDQIRENNECAASIKELTDSITVLKAKVDYKDAQIQHLLSRLEDKDAQVERLMARLDEKDARIAAIGQCIEIVPNVFEVAETPGLSTEESITEKCLGSSIESTSPLTSTALAEPAVPEFRLEAIVPRIEPVKPARTSSSALLAKLMGKTTSDDGVAIGDLAAAAAPAAAAKLVATDNRGSAPSNTRLLSSLSAVDKEGISKNTIPVV